MGTHVLVRMKLSGAYFVLPKAKFEEFAQQAFYTRDYDSEVIATGTQKQMFEFKRLTEEN